MSTYLINNLVTLMQQAEEMKQLKTGQAKKEYVIHSLRDILTLEPHIEDLLCEIVDLIIDVEKGKLVINPNIKNGCFKIIKKLC